MKKYFAILLISMIIFTLGACGTETTVLSDNTGSTAASTGSTADISSSTAAVAEQSTAAKESAANAGDGWIKIGKTVTVADVEYTVNAIKNSDGSDLLTPEDGNTYLLIDLNVKNKTAEEQPLSSIMMFDLQDGTGKSYSISFGGSAGLESEKIEMIDGSVAANSEKRGGMAYEVPKDSKGLKLTVKDVLGSGSQTIELN